MGCALEGELSCGGRMTSKRDTRSEPMKEALKTYFPGALTGYDSENLFAWELIKRGFTP